MHKSEYVVVYHVNTKGILDAVVTSPALKSWQMQNSVKHTLNVYLQLGSK